MSSTEGERRRAIRLAGVVYTELDPAGGWKLALVKELKAAGFNIDANKAMK